jgi:hypothetical protein
MGAAAPNYSKRELDIITEPLHSSQQYKISYEDAKIALFIIR